MIKPLKRSPLSHQLPVNTDRWYYRVFQGAPDLIRALLPSSDPGANALSLDPAAPGDGLYRFEALELKELSHRLDGVLWPRESTGCAETGRHEFPVLLLEVQMHPDSGFHHRLAAQTYRFLQQQPQIEHWAVLVITPHSRLNLGPSQPLRLFLEQQVVWLNLLTLPVRPESELPACSQQILASRPDLDTVVLPMLVQRFPQLTTAVSSTGQRSW